MVSITIFTISGLAIISLISAKRIEEKREGRLFILELISKGDFHAREVYHRAVGLYSEGKEKLIFIFMKKVPLHSKYSFNKIMAFIVEKRRRYLNHMRDSRLLKKSDGMSEFFKNISDVEKGNGEINDVYEDDFQNKE